MLAGGGRRYERKNKNLERCEAALDCVEALENRSLARDERIKQHKKAQRRKAAKERRAAMEDNKADMTAPAAEAAQERRRESTSRGVPGSVPRRSATGGIELHSTN